MTASVKTWARRGRGISLGFLLCAVVAVLYGCVSDRGDSAPVASSGGWDPARHEVIRWSIDSDEAFSQDHAIEASGLTSSETHLFVAAEKYDTILMIDPSRGYRARTLKLDLPGGSEIEGLAWAGDRLLMCDEAHGAVIEAHPESGSWASPGDRLVTRPLAMVDLEVPGGKVGLEGIAVSTDGKRVFALVERLRIGGGCASVIHRLTRLEGVLQKRGAPLVIDLDDCDWRLAGLDYHEEQLIALMTRFPGELYRIIRIDPDSGAWTTVHDITELAMTFERDGASNNLEGVTVATDGSLYIVSDNAATDTRPSDDPPQAYRTTVLVRLPPL